MGVAPCDVVDVAFAPFVGEAAPAVAAVAGAAVVACVDSVPAVAAVGAGALVGCCPAGGTAVSVALADPHAFRSAAPADTLARANSRFRNARRDLP